MQDLRLKTLLIAILLPGLQCFGQTDNQMNTVINDSLWVDHMLDVAYSLEIENPDSALAIYSQIISSSESIPYAVAQGKDYLYTGIVHSDQGQYDEAIESYLNSIVVFESVDYPEGIGSAYTNLGNIENRKAQYGRALAYYLDGI